MKAPENEVAEIMTDFWKNMITIAPRRTRRTIKMIRPLKELIVPSVFQLRTHNASMKPPQAPTAIKPS